MLLEKCVDNSSPLASLFLLIKIRNLPRMKDDHDVFIEWGDLFNSSNSIEVCVVGVNRPELLELTLDSFYQRLLYQWPDVKVVANIDPFPCSIENQSAFIDIYKRHFKSGVIRFSSSPSFARAVQWVWSNSTGRIIFHLEDDWICLQPIERYIVDLAFSVAGGDALQLLLPKVSSSRLKNLAGFSLNPMFIHGAWARRASMQLRHDIDPEKQIRHSLILQSNLLCKTSIYPVRHYGPIVYDTGSHWKRSLKIRKILGSDHQLSWSVKKPRRSYRLHMFYLLAFNGFGPIFSIFYGTAQRIMDFSRRVFAKVMS